MVATDPSDVLSTLIQRESVLYAVDVAGCEKRDIVAAVPSSRSTVDRSIRELEAAGLVTRAPEGYRRTLLGELLLSEYYRFKAQTAELLSAGEIFAELPPTQEIDRSMREDATIVTATQATPHQPVSALCSLIREAQSIRVLCPAVFPQLIETCAMATDTTETVEIILTDSVAAALVDSFTDSLAALQEAGAELHLLETTPPHGLAVIERPMGSTAGLLVIDDSGGRALVRNSGDDAVAWATNRLDHWRREATGLPLAETTDATSMLR
ncbi:hypothetical protein HKK80_12400 [Halonotius sp. F2-221B]|uniref:helix-turn-helix transcriptional regulator n=1 Tax=Halonotius sp. F2-221B TaxID=2731620 RepID=UPI00398B3858